MVDCQVIDYAWRGFGADAGYTAFQSRTGGPGAGHEPVFIAQHYLGIGAHIHQ